LLQSDSCCACRSRGNRSGCMRGMARWMGSDQSAANWVWSWGRLRMHRLHKGLPSDRRPLGRKSPLAVRTSESGRLRHCRASSERSGPPPGRSPTPFTGRGLIFPDAGSEPKVRDLENDGPAGAKRTPRCGALNRAGTPCQSPAMRGRKRCRIHGGLSPGAPRGQGNGRYVDGFWTAETIAERKWARSLVREFAKKESEE
jgi:hypothetical protein